ncbi:MAG TPA: RluA family pseudouridine synthase [Thermoanaerobaculia bacterium]|jgi:RluA family pseudouridine synthase
MRLDQAVAARNAGISRTKARELISERRVLVNDRPVGIASREVADSDRITIVEALPELTIIQQTDEWIAVDKPAGMPTQPTRDRALRSLEELLRVRYGSIFLVHRLDTGTSGVVVFARTRDAASQLSQLFASRSIRKTYLAVVDGTIAEERTIDTPIDGKDALTIVRPRGDSLVEVEIGTGRMHQIRIHLSSIGHPIRGDRRYGGSAAAPRMLLHAWRLEHEELGGILTAPLPADFPPV